MSTATRPQITNAQRAEAARANTMAELRDDARTILGNLLTLARQLRALAGTRQANGLGFLTATARAEIADMLRRDNQQRRTQPARDLGLAFLNRETTTAGTGSVPAAATVPAVSASAEIALALAGHVLAIRRAANASGLCLLPRLAPNADTGDLITQLDRLLGYYTRPKDLRALIRDLEHLERIGDEAVNGAQRTQHDDPCPHCGRPSLVIEHRDDVIRCAQDSRDDKYHECRCANEWCGCQTRPLTHRHTWHRSPAAAPTLDDTWNALTRLLDHRRNLMATALDAAHAINRLHQPGWWEDGQWQDHLVTTFGDGDWIPDDHECRPGCDPDRPDVKHDLLACVHCMGETEDGDCVYLLWPCPTAEAIAPLDLGRPEAPAVDEDTQP